MKLLVLSDSFPPHNLGGAGEVAHLVAREVAKQGHEVLVLTTVTRRADAGTARLDGLVVRHLWAPVPNAARLHLSVLNPLAIAQVRRAAAAFGPEVIHAHNVHERLSFGALGAARVGAAPLVLTAHDYLLFCLTKFLCSGGRSDYTATPSQCQHCRHIRRVPGRNVLVHATVRRHVATIACISQAQRTALGCNGFADVRSTVVYNGIDPHVYRPSAEQQMAFQQQHGLDGRPLVLFGGRISGAKGGDQLLRAMAEARRRVDAQLLIVGDRPQYFAHARRLANQVGLDQAALHTAGWLDARALDVAFELADVCATPSVYPDPFNLMNLRAMAHEKPVVGTCYGGTPEIVLDGQTGAIADPWQPQAFGARLAGLLARPDDARALGRAGRQRLEQSFTLERQANEYLALYRQVRAPAPRQSRPSSTVTDEVPVP